MERKSWLYEFLGQLPLSSLALPSRSQVKLYSGHLQQQVAFRASGVIDLKWVEMELSAASSAVLGTGAESAQLKSALYREQTLFGVEIGRYALINDRYFGRLAVGGMRFTQGLTSFRVSLGTGILATPEIPWGLKFHVSLFFPSDTSPSYRSFALEIARVYGLGTSSPFSLGVHLVWNRRHWRNEPMGDPFEHMLFSFGPNFSIDTGVGQLHAALSWRLWLDQKLASAGAVPSYPSHVPAAPDAFLSWTLSL